MAITTTEYNNLLVRLARLENTMNDVIVALEKFVTADQVNGIYSLTTNDIQALKIEVDSLASRLEDLEAEPLS